jgi:hypothetical protein
VPAPLTLFVDTVLFADTALVAFTAGADEPLFELPQALSASTAPARSASRTVMPCSTGRSGGWIPARATLAP